MSSRSRTAAYDILIAFEWEKAVGDMIFLERSNNIFHIPLTIS